MTERNPSGDNEAVERRRREFRDLGRRSLLSRDKSTGLPRELEIDSVVTEELSADSTDRLREEVKENDSKEEQ